MSILGELKRRKIFQVIAVYAVVAWLVVQVITSIEGPLNLPDWVDTFVIVLLGLGFPVLLVVSWAFNVTPVGLVRDEGGETTDQRSGRTIEFVLMGLVAVAVIWLLYRTEFSEAPTPETQTVAEVVTPDVLPNSIAVLPFANLSPDPDNAYFAAGIHDSILNELAKIRDMHVISRTTMVRYTDTEKSMAQIAEELRVETVMEGSIQYANGRVLVTAQLIDAQTDAHLWSDNYNEDFADIFGIQADIATSIAESLQAQVSPQEQESIQEHMTTSPEAYAYYLRVMAIAGDIGPGEDVAPLHDLLDRAIEADPSFARAYAIKSRLYGQERTGDNLATEYAEKALELDSDLGLAYYALGYNHKQRSRDAEARQAFSTALSLSPNEPNILDDSSRFFADSGDFETAIQLASRLWDIDPGFSSALGVVTLMSGDIDASLQAHRQVAQLNPDRPGRHLQLAIVERLAGNEEEALAEANLAKRLNADSPANIVAAYRYKAAGFQDEAVRLFDLFIERTKTEPATLQDWAFGYATIGDEVKLLEYLQLIAEEIADGKHRHGLNSYFAHNIYDDPMLEIPEFIEVRKRLGYDMSGIL